MSLRWRERLPRSMTNDDGDTTVRNLLEVIQQTRTAYRPCPGFQHMSSNFDRYSSGIDCDEVYPHIYIGDGTTAKNKMYLKQIGVTHILNTAEGNRFGMVDTDRYFYKDTDFKYLGLEMMDLPTTNIAKYFYEASNFIEDGIRSGGKVYVHCLMGMSRSSTCVLAYLMIKRGFRATEAIRTIRECRDVRPNEGFLQQLADLDNKLRREQMRALYR